MPMQVCASRGAPSFGVARSLAVEPSSAGACPPGAVRGGSVPHPGFYVGPPCPEYSVSISGSPVVSEMRKNALKQLSRSKLIFTSQHTQYSRRTRIASQQSNQHRIIRKIMRFSLAFVLKFAHHAPQFAWSFHAPIKNESILAAAEKSAVVHVRSAWMLKWEVRLSKVNVVKESCTFQNAFHRTPCRKLHQSSHARYLYHCCR